MTANEQVRTAQESLVARLNVVEQLFQQNSLGGSGSMDVPMPEPIPRSLTSPNVQQLEKRMTVIEDDFHGVYEDFKRRDKQPDERYDACCQEIEDLSDRIIKLEKDKATLQNQLDSKTQVQDQLQANLQALGNRVASEQSVHSTSIAQIQEDVRCLKEFRQSFERERDQLRSQISDQRALLDTIATEQSQHSTSIELVRSDTTSLKTTLPELQKRFETLSPSPQVDVAKDEVNPKLEALESDFRLHKGEVTHKVNAFENLLSTQQERWNNMTTEPMIQAVVYRVQQIPPLWNIKTTLDGHQSRIMTMEGKIMTMEGYLRGFAFEANQKHDDFMSKIQATQANFKAVEEKFKSRLAIAMQSGNNVEGVQPNSPELEQKVANLQHISSDFDLLRTELFALKEERSAFEAYRAETLREKQRTESEIQALQTSMSQSQQARAAIQGQTDALQDRYSGMRDEMRQELAKVPSESTLKKMREELQEELREELGKDFYAVHEVTRGRVEKVEGLVAESNQRVEKVEGLVAESAKDMKTGLARVNSLEKKTGSLEEEAAARKKKTEALDRSIEEMWVTVKKELVKLDETIRALEEKHAATATNANAASDDEDEPEIEDTQDRFVDAEESPSPSPEPRQAPSSARGSSIRRRGGHRTSADRKSKKRARYGISDEDDSDKYTEGSDSPPIRTATSSLRQRTARARGVKKIKTEGAATETAVEDDVAGETSSPRRSRGRPRRDGGAGGGGVGVGAGH